MVHAGIAVRKDTGDEVARGRKAKVVGSTVRDIPWPAGSVLVGLIREGKAIVPGPDDILEAGDHIYAMVSLKALKKLLKLLH